MIFRPELAQAILEGRKTVTRRVVSTNPRSPWAAEGCTLRPGGEYAVQPGRGVHAIGRVEVVSVTREAFDLVAVSPEEARREGFATWAKFATAWVALHPRHGRRFADVWRIEFRLVERSYYRAGRSIVRHLHPDCGTLSRAKYVESVPERDVWPGFLCVRCRRRARAQAC